MKEIKEIKESDAYLNESEKMMMNNIPALMFHIVNVHKWMCNHIYERQCSANIISLYHTKDTSSIYKPCYYLGRKIINQGDSSWSRNNNIYKLYHELTHL
jgi:hypothetical protein